MADFVDVDISLDPNAMVTNAVAQFNSIQQANGLPGNWDPQATDDAYILLQTLALIAVDLANVAATVTPAIFRAFGTQLLNVAYQNGGTASVVTTWNFTAPAPTGGYTIPAGTAVMIDGYAFYVQADVITNTGDTSASVLVLANQSGSAYNGLGGIGATVQPADQIDWVASITATAVTSGGSDQETDDDYQNRLANVLTLQAPRPITATDFAGMVLSDIAADATGISVGRATAIDGYYPDARALSTGGAGSTVLSCTTTNGSPTVQINTTLTTTVPEIGASVTGTGIPGSTTVAPSPAPTESSFTLSNNATASGTNSLTIGAMSGYGPVHLTGAASFTGSSVAATLVTPPYPMAIPDIGARVIATGVPSGDQVASSPTPTTTNFDLTSNATATETNETATFSSWTNVERCVTVFVTDVNGNALNAVSMDALAAWLETYREINFEVFVTEPSYSTIYVDVQIHALAGYDATALTSTVQSALLTYLSPANWGNPATSSNTQTWLNSGQGFNVVRFNKLLGVVENVPGVDYVPNGGLTLGFTASPSGTSDLTLPGPAPLPLSSGSTISVTTV